MSAGYGLRGYAGGAVLTTLAAAITNSTTTFSVTDGSTYPAANFHCVVDEGTPLEEKIFVGTRTGNVFSSVSRGEDGSVAQAHSGAPSGTVRHIFTAQDAAEANGVASVLTTKGDSPWKKAGGATTGWDRLPVGANGTILEADSAQGLGVKWGTAPLRASDYTAKGVILAGTGVGTETALAATNNGKVLTVTPAAATGLAYDYPFSVLTTAQRDALAGADLWGERIIFNNDTSHLEIYHGAVWQILANVTTFATTPAPTVKLGATTVTIVDDSRWDRILRKVTVTAQFRLSNLNAGAGTLTITRPVAGRMSSLANNYGAPLGTYTIVDVSAAAVYHGIISANLADGSDVVLRSAASPGVAVSNTAPITLAAGASGTGDEIYLNYSYEAAGA